VSASLLLVPLDDRPVSLDAPAQLAAVAGETLLLPSRERLGRFLQPGQPNRLADWLVRSAPDARAAILSLDMLAYGGLVASRTPEVTVDEALCRLQTLREIKAQWPGLRMLAFNVIMRLTITGADPETRTAGRNIFRYSVLRDRTERLGDAEAARELAAVEACIPRRLLEAYLAARARNHALNRAAVELLADGVLDFLALVQEDTAPAGLHVAEQRALIALAEERAAPERWRLYAGTDEAAMTLLARHVLGEAGFSFPVAACFRDDAAADCTALFEDVPLRETVRRHIDAAGGIVAAKGMALAAHTFTPPQPDLFEMPPLATPTWNAALATFTRTNVGEWLAGLHGPPAIADLAYCNGGDPHLLDALLAERTAEEIYGYAGWNTAGNTLGTALAHAALRACALARGTDPAQERAHREALLVRVLDDGLYQPIVRGWAMKRAEELGASPLNLGPAVPAIEAQVDDALHALWADLHARYPLAAELNRPFRATLPWGRLFEVRIELDPAVQPAG
jgi:hypothetical protein